MAVKIGKRPVVPFLAHSLSDGCFLCRYIMGDGTLLDPSGFLFNAEFEDHVEHVYAQFVREHPEWERQSVNNEMVKQYGDFGTWSDVFRRIGLDERDHMNSSFIFCNKPDCVVTYKGLPSDKADLCTCKENYSGKICWG